MALVGGEYSLSPRLKMELDLNWTGWKVFDTLAVNFARDTSLSSRAPQNFHDAIALRLGLEYQASKVWTLRAGAYYDETPQPAEAMSPLLSDTDRIGFTGGFGWNAGPFRLDGYALVLLFQDRSTGGQSLVHLDGAYKPRAFSAGLGVGFAL
jgi:long-chain fatty acid transport protein